MLLKIIAYTNTKMNPKQNQKLVIAFSQQGLEDLQAGETFDRTFETDKGESIDIHLRPETDEEQYPNSNN